MSQNKFTTNNNPTLVAVSNSDGETPVYLYADPATHGLVVSATISATGLATDTNQTSGNQKTQIVDGSGNVIGSSNNALNVNTVSLIPGTGATNLGKAEDSPHTNGDTGVAVLAVRDDTLNSSSGAEGDYEVLHTTADGALWITQAPSITNGWASFNATSGDGSTALTNSAQQVKGSVGTVGGWYIYNPNSSATYVNFYNVLAASVVVGTTNQQMVICLPATSGANVEFGNGITFSTAISISATTTGGGNVAPSTALEANIFYK